MPKKSQLNVSVSTSCVGVLKLFLLSMMNIHRFGKDRVTGFFLLNWGKRLTLAGKRLVKCPRFKVVSVTVVVKLGSHVNN